MLRARVLQVVVQALLLAGCPSGLEQMESSYQGRLTDIDAQAARVAPAKVAEIQQAKATFQGEYARLPPDPVGREAALGPLNQRMHAYIEQVTAYADAAQAQAQASQAQAAAAQGAQLRAQIAGNWTSPEMQLSITPQGMVNYHRTSGGTNRSVSAPMVQIGPTSFDVGIMGMNTTFQIQVPPHDAGGGVWKMTVDGVELTRQP